MAIPEHARDVPPGLCNSATGGSSAVTTSQPPFQLHRRVEALLKRLLSAAQSVVVKAGLLVCRARHWDKWTRSPPSNQADEHGSECANRPARTVRATKACISENVHHPGEPHRHAQPNVSQQTTDMASKGRRRALIASLFRNNRTVHLPFASGWRKMQVERHQGRSARA